MSKQAVDIPDQKDSRRVPKPLMEKRRRDRINQSLETLRKLLLENTHNEKLKNPKVEKAEILESVVDFLRAEQGSGSDSSQITGKRARTMEDDEDLSSPRKRQSYQDGMRTCLLRVSHFMTSKRQENGKGILPKSHPISAPPHEETQVHLCEDPSLPPQQHLTPSNPSTPSDCAKLTQRTVSSAPSMTSSPKQLVMLGDAVWRPW